MIAELQRRVDTESGERPVSADPPASAAEKMRRARLEEAKAEVANLDRDIASKTAEEKRVRLVRRIPARPHGT